MEGGVVQGAGLLSLLATSSKSIHFDETESESDPASRRQSLTRSSETPYYLLSPVLGLIDYRFVGDYLLTF